MIIAPMQSSSLRPPSSPWVIRLVTFLWAALAAASAGYWALMWPAAPDTTRIHTPEPVAPPIDTIKVAQLLGATSAGGPTASVVIASKYKLLGVIAQGQRSGSALIAIDGQPAKPYRMGERVADDLVLQSVKARSITLGAGTSGSQDLVLELPPLAGTP